MAPRAASLAVLLGEQGLGGPSPDLSERLSRWGRDRGQRANDARIMAARWSRGLGAGQGGEHDDGPLLAEAFPERIAKARGAAG